MHSNRLIIAIGNKARHGKDTFATLFKEEFPVDTYVTHWAAPLKHEVTNTERKMPLIYRNQVDRKYYYALLHTTNPHYSYTIRDAEEVPYLHKIFEERGIEKYMGMDEKDSEILQFWGTDFRRAQNSNYWVDKMLEEISTRPEKYILIPDTRFKNEYMAAKNAGGIYVRVRRCNADGTLYLDTTRDPNHKSEIDLDDAADDFSFSVKDADMEDFKVKALELIHSISKLV